MSAVWHHDGTGWSLLAPAGFAQEAALHDLVEQAPNVLPLAGSPRLTIVGREVPLGTGYADLVAIEPSGRLAIIEVKLAKNSEARRAVVAQVLAYAAYLQGLSAEQLEQNVLGPYLRRAGHETLIDAVSAGDQENAFEADTFTAGLAECLATGAFRLILVLDQVPDELTRLVGYLEMVTERIAIDLVAISAFDVGGSQILVPQRVEPERRPTAPTVPLPSSVPQGWLAQGADDFIAAIDSAPEASQVPARQLADWALTLEKEGLVKLETYHGKDQILSLLPRFRAGNVGIATIYLDHGKPALQLWRSVLARRAPQSLARIESLTPVSNGGYARSVSAELLEALTDAYREGVVERLTT